MEPTLVFLSSSQQPIGTKDYHVLAAEAKKLGPAHEEALAIQLGRQIAALRLAIQ